MTNSTTYSRTLYPPSDGSVSVRIGGGRAYATKGARRLEGFDANIVALYARGLATRGIGLELKLDVRR